MLGSLLKSGFTVKSLGFGFIPKGLALFAFGILPDLF
jgi:hypothetical protein